MNQEVCRLVKSIRGQPKLIVRGYLLVKDKNRNEKYYWCCEYKNMYHCKGRATTILNGQEHVLTKFSKHITTLLRQVAQMWYKRLMQ